jgi:hypothetical protein
MVQRMGDGVNPIQTTALNGPWSGRAKDMLTNRQYVKYPEPEMPPLSGQGV